MALPPRSPRGAGHRAPQTTSWAEERQLQATAEARSLRLAEVDHHDVRRLHPESDPERAAVGGDAEMTRLGPHRSATRDAAALEVDHRHLPIRRVAHVGRGGRRGISPCRPARPAPRAPFGPPSHRCRGSSRRRSPGGRPGPDRKPPRCCADLRGSECDGAPAHRCWRRPRCGTRDQRSRRRGISRRRRPRASRPPTPARSDICRHPSGRKASATGAAAIERNSLRRMTGVRAREPVGVPTRPSGAESRLYAPADI